MIDTGCADVGSAEIDAADIRLRPSPTRMSKVT
jgi:hypothetical protein